MKMIACKEDLIGTYILNDCGELREMYIKKALELGLSVNSACLTTSSDLIFTKSQSADFGMVDHAITIEHLERTYGTQREVTLMDLKPTKFVKVEESIFDLKDEFERGELYMWLSDEYLVVPNETQLSILLDHKQCYRQVEADWRDEVRAKYPAIDFRDVDGGGYHDVGSWDSDSFIRLCHLVASLTEKPTNG